MTFTFEGKSVDSGDAKWITLEIGQDTDMRSIVFHTYVVNGHDDGPVLWVQGNIHGDEAVGGIAVRDQILDLEPDVVSGTIVGVPVANPMDLLYKQRGAPINDNGSLDAGRVFPGNPDGSYSERLAHRLFTLITEYADYVVETHSPDKELLMKGSCAGFVPTGDEVELQSQELAQATGYSRLLELDPDARRGFSAVELAKSGVPSIILLDGTGSRIYEWAYKSYQQGIQNVMQHHDIYPGESNLDGECVVHTQFVKMQTDHGGFVENDVEPGELVEKNQILGRLTNLKGEKVQSFEVEFDAVIVAVRTYPIARPGDAMYELVPQK